MLSSVAEWVAVVLAAGVVAAIVVLLASAAGVWWLRRRVRRLLKAVGWQLAGHARSVAAGVAVAGLERLAARATPDLPRSG